MKVQVSNTNSPVWRDITVKSHLPSELSKLSEIAKNIWWVWNYEAKRMFASIDPKIWTKTQHNPVLLLELVGYDRLNELKKDKAFLSRMDAVYTEFKEYVNEKPNKKNPTIAYFSMEYGMTNVLKIYSGGLGVLAGDYLKEASDCNIDLTAVGFMYRYGYFTQGLSMEGQQVANYEAQNFAHQPVEQVMEANGTPAILEVPFPDRIVYSYIWKVNVGRISLYLMDTDLTLNSEWDRSITHQLYGGDWENRMKQEYLLGVGGILLLNKLGIKKEVYHCNEGHAALINAQRLADYIEIEKLDFSVALELVRSSSLYTVHTPVPAGHDSFDEGLFSKYMGHFPQKLGISWQDFIDMGREHPGSDEKFSMSVFACNTCQEVNGVSELHGRVSQEMFNPIWKGYFPEELHVGYVTNGVHMPTWAAAEWQEFFKNEFPSEFWKDQSNEKLWEPIQKIADDKIWKVRTNLKNKLINYIRDQFKDQWLKNQGDPSKVVSIMDNINPNALIIGFGRRFATYKRAHLLFTDLERLSKIVNNEKFPVLFFFTGKAHPADGGGQALIKHIVEISRRPEFLGKVIFLENYDMLLAKRLVSGVDIWLNTPTRPLEASGTSGEKAEMNGVLNFSVKDGWWYEGYRKNAGWALTEHRTYQDQGHQDQLDAATIYAMLENEIIPLYYAKNSKGFSPEWIQFIKNSFTQIAPDYTTKRMLDDYIARFYSKLKKRSTSLKANNYDKAHTLATWKDNVVSKWDSIEVISITSQEELSRLAAVNEDYTIEVVLDLKGLDNQIGVEAVILGLEDGKQKVVSVNEFKLSKIEGNLHHFQLINKIQNSGEYKYAFRMFPKHEDLPHRQDFCYVRWI
ncbi:MAG: alpha-glucan family phosphorylase [Bacteroidales bacterium]|nr:alpha-glucan family phosphorylase [Bacteroidales bacterium]